MNLRHSTLTATLCLGMVATPAPEAGQPAPPGLATGLAS